MFSVSSNRAANLSGLKLLISLGYRQFKHDDRPGLVAVPGKLGDDLAPGTYNSILKQAGLK